MCLAVPGRLVEMEGLNGVVEMFGVRRDVRLDLIDNPSLGDQLLLHAGFAIERIDEERAAEITDLLRQAVDAEEGRA